VKSLSAGASEQREKPMSTVLSIRAIVLADLREALLCLMGDATEAISQVLERPGREHHPEWFHAARMQLDQVFALLDVIGWEAVGGPRDVKLDSGEHVAALREAVDCYLPLLEGQAREAEVDDKRRTQEGRLPRKEEVLGRLVQLRELAALIAHVSTEPAD
jgi:hypothetical protein